MIPLRSLTLGLTLLLLAPALAQAKDPPAKAPAPDLAAKIHAFEARATASDRRIKAALDELRDTVADHEARLRVLETQPRSMAQPMAPSMAPFQSCAPAPSCGQAPPTVVYATAPSAPAPPTFQNTVTSTLHAMFEVESGISMVERLRSISAPREPPKPVEVEPTFGQKAGWFAAGFLGRSVICLSAFGLAC